MIVLDVVTTVSIGLLIGTELAVSVFVNPVVERLETSARVKAIALFAKRLGAAMPLWYVLSALLLITETLLRRHEAGVRLLVVASALWVAVIVLTLIFLVPINNRLMRVEAGDSADAALREHRRWDRLHRARVAVLAVAMICFLLAILR